MNGLYFSNIIPPIPLSLKDIGAYHFVARSSAGEYVVYGEDPSENIFAPWRKTYHRTENEPVYVYSAVFAPTKLNTAIVHHWQYYDPAAHKWVSASKIRFPITGGRDGGYRGYSFKENIFPGKWRVDVTTERGQIIGRISFAIESTTTAVFLHQGIK